jgi:hypothetical protein
MKFSQKTIDVIKNFSSINQGMLFKQGKVLKTVSPQRNVMSQAGIEDEITNEFSIYDLNNFLNVISLTDDAEFEFDDQHVVLKSKKGRGVLNYRFTAQNMIVSPPEKEIQFPEAEIKLTLEKDDLEWLFKASTVLGTPNIGIYSDGAEVFATAFDGTGSNSHSSNLKFADGNGDIFNIHFKIDCLKIIPGTYDVEISSKGVSHWTNKNEDIQYWITTEPGSKYQKA